MKTKPSTIVAVDNGITGGICILNPVSGAIKAYRSLPTHTVAGKTEVDYLALLDWVEGQIGPEACKQEVDFVIEEPLKHAKTSQAMRSMSISFGATAAAFQVSGYRVHRIQVLDWQKKMLGKRLAAGQTKIAALQKARERWPEEKWFGTPRSYTPHDGVVDAALIGLYHLEHNQYNQ